MRALPGEVSIQEIMSFMTSHRARNKRLHLCEHDWFVSAAQCIFTLSPVCMQTFRLQQRRQLEKPILSLYMFTGQTQTISILLLLLL